MLRSMQCHLKPSEWFSQLSHRIASISQTQSNENHSTGKRLNRGIDRTPILHRCTDRHGQSVGPAAPALSRHNGTFVGIVGGTR
jgi:hypothetical protein